MNKHAYLLALAIGIGLTVPLTTTWAASSSGGKKSYKWVDDKGATHYGDTVPPEYASQGRSELNNQGVELRQFPRQLSPAEAADAQKTAADESRRRQHDSFLLTTYTQVSDIEQLRDERLALIDGQMDIARGSIDSTNQRIKTLEARLNNFKPYSQAAATRRVPDRLADEVVHALHERRSLLAGLAAREAEKTNLRADFELDISRYRELTAPRQLR